MALGEVPVIIAGDIPVHQMSCAMRRGLVG